MSEGTSRRTPGPDNHELYVEAMYDEQERERRMKCEVCNQGPPNGPTIHRVNKPGEMPARWRCVEHLTSEQKQAIDPVIKDIVETIQHGTDWPAIVKDTPKTDAEVERLRRLRYHEAPETIPHVEAGFARELEREAREYKLELSRSLERETTIRDALSLARQYIAGEFGFENWRIEKIDTLANARTSDCSSWYCEQCGKGHPEGVEGHSCDGFYFCSDVCAGKWSAERQ